MFEFVADPKLKVEPSYYDGGIPVFEPTMAQFEDFYKFNKAINSYGMQSGIVKIVPPQEWKDALQGNYTQERLETVRVKNPIIQHISNPEAGVFSQQNIERPRTYSIFQWKQLSEKSNHQPPRKRRKEGDKKDKDENKENQTPVSKSESSYTIETDEFDNDRCSELETAYWKSLTYAEPMYGADVMGSLFSDSIKSWNVAHLPNILDLMDVRLPGVNDAYLYAGLWKATFSWHLEDQDLYSINYIHFGAPKQWYSIPQEDSGKFYQLMKDTFTEEWRLCPEFLRHKTFLVSPQFLAKHNVRCNKIVHREGEFIITYPFGYHAGFNYGHNLAESVNFALDDWFPYGEVTKKCECISDSVGINVRQIYCKYKGIPYDYEESTAPNEPDEGKEEPKPRRQKKEKQEKQEIKRPRGRPRKDDPRTESKVTKPAKSTGRPVGRPPKKIELSTGECMLCPNNCQVRIPQFSLLRSDQGSVHEVCARMFPVNIRNGKISGLDDLKPFAKLKCQVCKSLLGCCFQCDHPKCTRSFHATCGLAGGVLYDCDGKNYCRYHRNQFSKMSGDNADAIAKTPVDSLVQFQFGRPSTKDIYCGLVTANNVDENSLSVLIYPALKDAMEVRYADVVVGSNTAVDNQYFYAKTRRQRRNSSVIEYPENKANYIMQRGRPERVRSAAPTPSFTVFDSRQPITNDV